MEAANPVSQQGPGTMVRGELFWADRQGDQFTLSHEVDGALAIDAQGLVRYVGSWAQVPAHLVRWPTQKISPRQFITPGFIDLHLHFPQTEMIGAWAGTLLQWLEKKTFPAEEPYGESGFAATKAKRFCQILASHGLTTTMVFSSSHQVASEQLFKAYEVSGLRGVLGKVSMDQHAPQGLIHDVAGERDRQLQLINDWHGLDQRLFVALTPRFVPSCSQPLLELLGQLAQEHPDVYIQSHIDENLDEVAWVKELFPKAKHYFDVYVQFHLATRQTFLAHGVHTSPEALAAMRERGVTVTHCPTSNMFLGSGLFPGARYDEKAVPYTYASDVGAGTSFSPWMTMAGAYQVAALTGRHVTPEEIFARMTLVPAERLAIPELAGSFKAGAAADYVVWEREPNGLLDPKWQELTARQRIFRALFHSAELKATSSYVRGKKVC